MKCSGVEIPHLMVFCAALEYEKSLWLTFISLFFAFKESDCLVTIIYLYIKSSLIILQTLEMLSTVCIGGFLTHFLSSSCVCSLFIQPINTEV